MDGGSGEPLTSEARCPSLQVRGDEATVGRGVFTLLFTLQARWVVIDGLLRGVLGLDVRRRRTSPQKHEEKS